MPQFRALSARTFSTRAETPCLQGAECQSSTSQKAEEWALTHAALFLAVSGRRAPPPRSGGKKLKQDEAFAAQSVESVWPM